MKMAAVSFFKFLATSSVTFLTTIISIEVFLVYEFVNISSLKQNIIVYFTASKSVSLDRPV